jgi:GNAT superfamily N-acetyltransferase
MPNSEIRQIEKPDLKYVCQSWLYDYQKSPEMDMPGLISDDYFGYQHKLMDGIISRASKAGTAYIMNEPGHPHLYRGWLVAEPYRGLPVVHFIKVKKGAMKQGVATALMNRFYEDFGYAKGQNCVYTHSAKDIARYTWLQRRIRKDWSGVYLPWFKYTIAENGCEKCGVQSWDA